MNAAVLEVNAGSAEADGTGNGSAPLLGSPTQASDAPKEAESLSKLSIQGQGLTFEREIPDALVLRIMHLVLSGGAEPTSPSPSSSSSRGGDVDERRDVPGGGRRESLVEFYRRVGPKTNPEKLATMAYYLQEVVGRTTFTSDDLKSQFRAVNEPQPGNLSRDFRLACGEGWLAEDHDERGQFYVTRSGIEAVTAAFQSEGNRKAPRPRRRKRTTRPNSDEGSDDSE